MTVTRTIVVGAVLMTLSAGAPRASAQDGRSTSASTAETRERNIKAYTELLRSDLRTSKIAALTELMQFSEDEDRVFWPVYRDYEVELARLNDDRLHAIEDYAAAYKELTPDKADNLVKRALELEARLTVLKQRYYERLKMHLSPVRAAKVIQIENQIQLLVDLQVAASLPTVP